MLQDIEKSKGSYWTPTGRKIDHVGQKDKVDKAIISKNKKFFEKNEKCYIGQVQDGNMLLQYVMKKVFWTMMIKKSEFACKS